MISIKVDGAAGLAGLLNPTTYNKAIVRSVNDTASMARTSASRSIRDKYNITATRLNQGLMTISGVRRATSARPWAKLDALGPRSRPGLQHFAARTLKRGGVSYKIMKQEARKTFPRAFMTTMPKGGEGIFMRKYRSRLPIVRKAGPSVPEMFNQAGIEAATKRYNDEFFTVFERNFDYYLSI